ncbi:MAG: hypothetical protein WBE68_12360 [Candidatus Nitrosopolaris sp.]
MTFFILQRNLFMHTQACLWSSKGMVGKYNRLIMKRKLMDEKAVQKELNQAKSKEFLAN